MFLIKIESLQHMYIFDSDWQSYLKDKEYSYYNSITYRERKTRAGFEEYTYDVPTPQDLMHQQNRMENDLAEFCRDNGISFKPETNMLFFDPYDFDEDGASEILRKVTKIRKCTFVVPAKVNLSMLHQICSKECGNLVKRLTPYSWKGVPATLPADQKKIADAAVAMVAEEIKLFAGACTGPGEYKIHLIVNPEDFRYDEPGGDVAGIIFGNEGMAALRSKDERELLMAAVLDGVYGRLKTEDRVLDGYAKALTGEDPRGCHVELTVMCV